MHMSKPSIVQNLIHKHLWPINYNTEREKWLVMNCRYGYVRTEDAKNKEI